MTYEKLNTKDVTFVLIAKFDTIERMENALMVIDYLLSNYCSPILLWEVAPYNNGIFEKMLPQGVSYTFRKDDDSLLHRTAYINQMVADVETDYVAVWDLDVIVPLTQIIQSVRRLHEGDDFVYPYTDLFLDTTEALRRLYAQTRDLGLLIKYAKFMPRLYKPHPVGGAFFANKKSYEICGMENEAFYGWGMEDGERLARWMGQKMKVAKIKGPLFHLTHPRGINSVYSDSSDRVHKYRIYLDTIRSQKWDIQ